VAPRAETVIALLACDPDASNSREGLRWRICDAIVTALA
jgi:hypothetical protein